MISSCRRSGASVHDVVQASIDLLLFTVIRAAPTVDDAERDIGRIAQCMRDNIRRSYVEFHTMVEAQLHTIAAMDSTSLVPILASRHPPLNSTGVPVGDGLRPIDAQF